MSMPEANRRTVERPIRVYAPSRGNLALQPEAVPATRVAEPARRPVRKPQPAERPAVRTETKKQRRTLAQIWKAYKVTPKIIAVCCVCLAAGAMLFMVRRYSRIASVQSDINRLSSQISQLESSIEKTNVDYMFSIDIGAAHNAARAAGMVYPDSESFGN